MKIGCVKEIKKYEFRVGLTPDNAREYILHGHRVMVESGAGLGSSFADEEYQAAGAEIAADAESIWRACGMVIKVKEPLAEEYESMRRDQILYTYLHLAADKPLTEALLRNGVKAIAYETIRDGNGALPLLKPMSEVAGRLSIQEGAKCLEKPMGGRGVLLGGVPGVKKGGVLIIGAGIVGVNACKIAVGLGADVAIMDNNLMRLTYLDDIFGSSVQTMYSTESAIEKAIGDADLVIGSVLIPGAAAPKLIKRRHLAAMREGSVIVDVAVDQGGCCETTRATYHDQPTFIVDGVVHYCVANMPGAVANTSTLALTNATLPYGLAIADKGAEAAARADRGLYPGVNCYKGKVTCRGVAEAFGMEFVELETLL
ncbi:MAG: alanine dehydrogenase [Planctomycetota bacterium]|jgi:alanine dehydrogenase|nr:alanine dehydrogenase [Planctomycetota bacterium]